MKVRGRPIVATHFRVFHRQSHRDDYRMAVVVSKKIAKSAVMRNRIRRRLYETVRQSGFLDGQSYDVVFVVTSDGVALLDNNQLQAEVYKTLQRITQ
jgi:ribonuclease P protein component